MSNVESLAPVFRRSVRKSVEFQCEICCSHADEPVPYEASEMSSSGMWVATDQPLRTGEHVVVCFQPGGSWGLGELMVFAEVARVATSRRRANTGSAGMALEFMDIEPHEARELERWLMHRRAPAAKRAA